MSYTALYRKFRPNVFAGVVGQDHIVKTLKNQMKTGRVSLNADRSAAPEVPAKHPQQKSLPVPSTVCIPEVDGGAL